MFYNYCRSTKAGLIDRNKKSLKTNQKSVSHSPTHRMLNISKRQKLKNLLMIKFMEKYNINYPHVAIEKEVTRLSLLFKWENKTEFEFRKYLCEKRRNHSE